MNQCCMASVIDTFAGLEEDRQRAKDAKDYRRAGQLRKKIETLKVEKETELVDYLKSLHEDDIANIEQEHEREFSRCQTAWETYIQDYRKAGTQCLASLEASTRSKITDFNVRAQLILFSEKGASNPPLSQKLLDLKVKEKALADLDCYAEADKVHEKASKLEAKELLETTRKDSEMLERITQTMTIKADTRISSLRDRIMADLQNEMKLQERDLSILKKRNQNLLSDLSGRHIVEIKKLRMTIKSILNNPSNWDNLALDVFEAETAPEEINRNP